jgi:diadenosine tetraphosphate (Ap4A) HIT family hydrolase
VIFEDPSFVVVARNATDNSRGHLTLLPRAHVSTLTELTPDDMASVLAGLAKLVLSIKWTQEAQDVEIRTHPRVRSHRAHVHFDARPRAPRLPDMVTFWRCLLTTSCDPLLIERA